MKFFLVLSLVVLGSASVPDYHGLWNLFKLTYNKNYDTNGVEEASRFNIFQHNVDIIQAHNAKNLNYKYGINAFCDLTTKEFGSARLGWKLPENGEFYGGVPFLGNHTYLGEDLPTSVDHVANGLVTPIKDQGQCGSCWIFSAVGALEGAYAKARGKDALVSLAEQQVLDCEFDLFPPTMGCSGGSMGPVFGFAKKHAMCTTESYPYEAAKGTCREKNCIVGVAKGDYTGWVGLAPIAKLIPASYHNMMSAVAQQPVSVSIEADKDVFHLYKKGIVKGACGQLPDHGVLVVGYGRDPELNNETYYKIKNSWGESWGENGYVRILRDPSSWRGECAILNGPSYPVASTKLLV